MTRKKLMLGIFSPLLLLGLACNINVAGFNLRSMEVDALRTEHRVVEVGRAQSVRAKISMSAGELKVSSDADNLVSADFTYNIDEWTPQVTYLVDDAQGDLTIRQPSPQFSAIPTDEIRNKWDIQLGNMVPMQLTFEIGAGASTLNLGDLSVEQVNIEAGAGDTMVNLANSSLSELNVDAGIGKMTIDLSGEWRNDLEAEIRNGMGELIVILPRDVGVQVAIDTGLGEVDAGGLRSKGGLFVNDAYGQSEVTLNIDLKGGIGQITLQQDG